MFEAATNEQQLKSRNICVNNQETKISITEINEKSKPETEPHIYKNNIQIYNITEQNFGDHYMPMACFENCIQKIKNQINIQNIEKKNIFIENQSRVKIKL